MGVEGARTLVVCSREIGAFCVKILGLDRRTAAAVVVSVSVWNFPIELHTHLTTLVGCGLSWCDVWLTRDFSESFGRGGVADNEWVEEQERLKEECKQAWF